MSDVPDAILIARCPIHGLHGERERCYVCDLPCEQVRLVSAERLRAAEGELNVAREAHATEVDAWSAAIRERDEARAQLATLRGVVERIGRFASSFTDESNDWLRVVQACERALAVPTVSADHCGYEKPHDPHGWDGDGFPDSETRCPGTPDALSDQEAGA